MLLHSQKIIQEISAATKLNEALTILVKKIKAEIATDACSVYLKDSESDQYFLAAADGFNPELIGKLRIGKDHGLVGWIAKHEEAINLQNASDHQCFHNIPETGEESYHGFLGAPIIHYRQVLGVLVTQKQERQKFGMDEMAFFITISSRLGSVIHHFLTEVDFNAQLGDQYSRNIFVQGIPCSPGIAIGTIIMPYMADLQSVPDRITKDIGKEEEFFRAAIVIVKKELQEGSKRISDYLPNEARMLFEAYEMLLESDRLISGTVKRIHTGNWASGALRDTIMELARVFEKMEDPYMAVRAEDIRNIGRHILIHLQGNVRSHGNYPEHTILAASELSLSEIEEVPRDRLAGIICKKGSALSHTSIMARALSIPAVMGLTDLSISYFEDSRVIVDGNQGRIYIEPLPEELAKFQQQIEEERKISNRLEAFRNLPAETKDGIRIPLYANLGVDIQISLPILDIEGVGLYRSEFFFLSRESLPTEDEQYQHYRNLLESFAPRLVTIRTLDIGGDKTLPYFPMKESNPFLGWRGIRVMLDHPEIFLIQLRALLRANAGIENLKVLFPMISRVSEINDTLNLIDRAYNELLEEGMAAAKPQLGAMIEVPSAIFLIPALSRLLDFFSIGTNDLTQYLLAVDRTNPRVMGIYDSLHPAVIKSIYDIVEISHKQNRLVTVCGEMASDPASALLLIGTGVDALSMNPSSIPRIKWAIRNFTKQQAISLLKNSLQMEDAISVHHLLNSVLKDAGLDILVRAS
ncbi:MAG: phosphoenolpyruvate--protein phosphotransferase [Desulfobacterales bacterium]|nr:phosphoenolpyruvate--protein phosphotransferase [Desulfobacterales bacterium]